MTGQENVCIVCDGHINLGSPFLTCSITCEEVLEIYIEEKQKEQSVDYEMDCN